MIFRSHLESDTSAPAVPDVTNPWVLAAKLLCTLEDLRHTDVEAVLGAPVLEVEVFVEDIEFRVAALVDCDFDVVRTN
jgi:hypothetical protein